MLIAELTAFRVNISNLKPAAAPGAAAFQALLGR
jgi:hypothetical protein